MVGVSRLLLPLVVNEFHVLGTLWQEIYRYWQRRDRFNTTNRQHRTNSIEITRRNSCGIATAAKSDTPACRYLLGSCHSEFQGVGPVCHKWPTCPKPWPKKQKTQRWMPPTLHTPQKFWKFIAPSKFSNILTVNPDTLFPLLDLV